MELLSPSGTMLHHPLFFGGKGEAVEDNESPRIPFLPPIVSMATQAYPTRSHSHLQHPHHHHHHSNNNQEEHNYEDHHRHHHHHPFENLYQQQRKNQAMQQQQQNQRQQQQQQQQRHSYQHHPTQSSLPRPTRDSAMTLRLGPVARARTFAAESAMYDSNYLPRLDSKVRSNGGEERGRGRTRYPEIGGGKGEGRGGGTRQGGEQKYPRIVVRDALGRSLDTFTTLQEAIYRASWMRKKMGEYPKTPLQWRLPKAPVPSKPDYTRAGEGPGQARLDLASSRDVSPHDPHSRGGRGLLKDEGGQRRLELTAGAFLDMPTLEIPVDDVSFVRESLNHLPNLPAFTFLRHSLLAGRGTYVHIVASILLHQKQLRSRYRLDRHGRPIENDDDTQTPDDVTAALQRMRKHKQPDYEFPGLCTGCRRAGFCYGCEKNPKPHVHEDVPAMMGGGFRFYRRDRPRDPHPWKHPANWNLPESEAELMNIIKEHGGLQAYEQAVSRARQEMLKMMGAQEVTQDTGTPTSSVKYQRLKSLSTYPPQVTIVSTEDYGDDRRLSEFDKEEYDDEEDEEEMEMMMMKTYDEIDKVARDEDKTLVKEENQDEELLIEEKEEDEEEDEEVRDDGRRLVERVRERKIGVASSQDTDSVQSRPMRIDTGIDTDYTSDADDVKSARGRKPKVSIMEPRDSELSKKRHMSSHSKSSKTRSDSGSRSRSSPPKARTTSRVEYLDFQKEQQKEEEARLRRERAKESVPFGKKRRDIGYTAPKIFTVQKKSRRITVAKDPFSTDRQLNVPKGGTFQIKKSERKTTQFAEFGKGERGWTAPKKFEVKAREKKTTQFWTPPPTKSTDDEGKRRRRKRDESDSPGRRRRGRESSTDSGLGTGDKEADDATSADEKAPLSTPGDGVDQEADATTGQEGDADVTDSPQKPKRREVVKKTRVERKVVTPPESPTRLPSPPPFKRRVTPPPTPPTPPESPGQPEVPLPELDLDLPTVPDLPELQDKEPEKRKQKLKFTVEPPPTMQVHETPKKRRAAPKVRIIPKNLSRPMKSRPAEAPVTSEEMQQIQDPLDFLAKYCIINPDRIPFYEIIFETTVADQTPRYSKAEPKDSKPDQKTEETSTEQPVSAGSKKKSGSSKSRKSSKKSKSTETNTDLRPGLFAADRGMYLDKPAMTLEEQHLEKLIYTLDLLQDKMTTLGSQLADLDVQRTRFIATKARFLYPEVSAPDYFPKLKKKKGKKGKKSSTPDTPARRLRPEEITDDVICARLDDKMLNEICKDPDVKKTEVAMDILRQKIAEIQKRVEELASEKLLADAFCMNHYFWRQGLDPGPDINSSSFCDGNNNNNNNKGDHFRRQQSELYNRLRPQPNFEMNLDEVEDALQQINNHLLTEKEFFFLYNILNLPRREKINFRLFSIIAALSEKVTQLDPVIRKLINNFNYNALDIKMEKCKELFDLLENDYMPKGGAKASSLAVELTAGGLRPEHTKHVLTKFNRESRGVIDFLDFVTYVPLFVEIHKRIISDPLRDELDL